MKNLIKNYFPDFLVGLLKKFYSYYRIFLSRKHGIFKFISKKNNPKPRILFYDINGLFYAGTQKFIQILAKYLDKDKYEVFFMFSSQNHKEREYYMENSGVKLIDFKYDKIEKDIPFYISGMNPSVFDVIKDNNIDLFIATGSGYPEFPVANIKKLPIIFLNIFGSINVQKNIKKHVCISKLLSNILSHSIPKEKIEVMYVPSEGPDGLAYQRGLEFRKKLGFSENDVVFGRIGRPDDNIFDPIGIYAFEKALEKFDNIHYLIIAPSPKLEEIVKNKKIRNVHFLPSISEEEDIWSFHHAIDVLAHFRKDGETCGLNIAESMLCGKPIISHKSDIWNAHLEYLDESFSRVAEQDDIIEYSDYMVEFINKKKSGELFKMGKLAKEKAENLFSPHKAIKQLGELIDNSLK